MTALRDRAETILLAGMVALILARLAALMVSPLLLYPDEAQYWGWSREFAFGYYSKPPMIAWLIGLTTSIFGNAEWAVRLAAPFLHAGTAFFLYLAANALFRQRRLALYVAAAWLVMPGASLSSFVIATDAPLLTCIAFSLFALIKYVKTGRFRWALALGAGIGVGFLAKYAMLFFVIGMGLGLLTSGEIRRALLHWKALAGGVLAVAIFSPNLFWNAANGFATVAHTADNANLQAELFNPENLLEFWFGQFAVAGPVLFPLIVVAIIGLWRRRDSDPFRQSLRWLTLFALPALVIISGQAFLSRAHANWAASAYPAALMLAVVWGFAYARPLVLLGLAANAALSGVFLLISAFPGLGDAIGMDNSFKRMRGWDEISARALSQAEQGGFDRIVTDDRFIYQTMAYHARGEAAFEDMRMWLRLEGPNNHAELNAPLTPGSQERLLLISRFHDHEAWFAADFESLRPLEDWTIATGPDRQLVLKVYEASGYDPVSPRGGGAPPTD